VVRLVHGLCADASTRIRRTALAASGRHAQARNPLLHGRGFDLSFCSPSPILKFIC